MPVMTVVCFIKLKRYSKAKLVSSCILVQVDKLLAVMLLIVIKLLGSVEHNVAGNCNQSIIY